MPRNHGVFSIFPNIPYKLWLYLRCKQSKKEVYGTFDMAQASEKRGCLTIIFKDKSVYGPGYSRGQFIPPRDKV